nr:response regulator [Pleionea sp. CnH1-48]
MGCSDSNQYGTVYFCGISGVYFFNKHEPNISQYSPPIIFRNIKKDGSKNDLLEGGYIGRESPRFRLTLEPERTGFSTHVIALDYVNPYTIHYQYFLKGFSSEWQPFSFEERNLHFTNLAPGDYELQVRSTNRDGVWSDNTVSIDVQVLPFFWQTWWFKLAIFVVVILTVIMLFRLRLKSLSVRAMTLEKMVVDRTEEIASKNKEISKLLETKETFIANVTHEFKTPLTLILGPVADLVGRSQPESYLNRQLSMINRSALRLTRLVEHLLDFSKPLSSEEQYVGDVNQLVKVIVEPFEDIAKSKRIELSLSCSEEELCVPLSSEELERVVVNLLSNAIKYNRKGGCVDVSSYIQKDTWRFEVKDTGLGIHQKDLSRIFERFSRSTDSYQEKISGTGLGLALVKEIVEAKGGCIMVESDIDIGSQFTVSLPLEKRHNDRQRQETVDVKAIQLEVDTIDLSAEFNQSKNNPLAEFHVLIVDDNADMCSYIQLLLDERFSSHCCYDGAEGLAYAREYIPDLVISDVMMPEMDGFEFCQQLKSNETTSHIPMILLTALNDSESKIKGLRYLADDYLTKPFNKEELIVRLENILTIRKLLQSRVSNEMLQSKSSIITAHSSEDEAEQAFVLRIKAIVSENYQDTEFSPKSLYLAAAMSERQMQRKMKAVLGLTPVEFIRIYRLEKARELLVTKLPIADVAEQVGFASPTYFSQCFKAHFGVSPSAYDAST